MAFFFIEYIVWFKKCCYLLLFSVPVVEKRLMDVKLGQLGTWLGGRDFTPNGILSAVRRGKLKCFWTLNVPIIRSHFV